MPDLRPCPCGKTPTRLAVAQSCSVDWAWVSGDCCCKWAIEFRRSPLVQLDELMRLATAAWNDAPRKGEG